MLRFPPMQCATAFIVKIAQYHIFSLRKHTVIHTCSRSLNCSFARHSLVHRETYEIFSAVRSSNNNKNWKRIRHYSAQCEQSAFNISDWGCRLQSRNIYLLEAAIYVTATRIYTRSRVAQADGLSIEAVIYRSNSSFHAIAHTERPVTYPREWLALIVFISRSFA